MNLLMIFSVILIGRISDWDHYTHFGGVSDILVEEDFLVAATTGGVIFGHIQSGSVYWDSTWTCPGELSFSDARCLARDAYGNLWIGTKGGGIDVSLASGGFQHYGQLEGLPISLQISCILPDTTIWVGTSEGLCSKELGYFNVWTVFTTGGGLPSDIINCVAQVDSGLFVGTSSGLAMLRAGQPPGQSDSWVEFSSMENLIVQDILVAGDTAWATTADGLYRMTDGALWVQDTSYPGGSPICLDWSDGRLAVGDKGNASVYENGSWTPGTADLGAQVVQDIHWHSADELIIGQYNDFAVDRASGNCIGIGYIDSWVSARPSGAPSNDLYCVDVDLRDDVWVTSNRRGASVLSDEHWYEFMTQLPSPSQVFACAADQSGGVFISPWHFGVVWIDWKGTPDTGDDNIVLFNTSNSDILNDQVNELVVSLTGEVWLAHEAFWQTPTEPSGVSRLSWTPGHEETASWRTFQPSDGLPSGMVRSVETVSSPQAAWMGTQEGLVLGNIQTGQVMDLYSSSSGLPSSDIQSLAISRDGKLYVGTTAGLVMIDPETGNLTEIDQVSGNVSMLCFDNLSALWTATGDGLFRIYPDGTVEEYNTINSPLQSNVIRYAAADPDNGLLYLATDHGMWRLHLEQGMGGTLGSATVYPNPFIPGDGQVLGVAGLPNTPFDIRLFDLTGGLVYESLSQYRDDFSWDGIDLEGNPVASGTYMVRITQDGGDRFVKLALVR